MAKITKQYLDFNGLNLYNEYVFSKIKQSDWTVNDPSDPRYVENRTHYVGDPVETILLEETSIEFIDTDTVLLPGFIKLIEGCTYFVTFNRTEYECVAYGYNDSGMVIIGNGSLFGIEGGNGEPFVSVFMDENTSALFVTQEAGTYALKIVGMIPEVVQLPAQFLVNSNICNGEGGYSIKEGMSTAYGDFSHAEGRSTAYGDFSHAEGEVVVASGHASHAEGEAVIAPGHASHAEGYNTAARGKASHAEGIGTIADDNEQHVQGRYNLQDTEKKYAHIVGNGTEGTRSNAHTLDWEGNAWFAGKIYAGGTGQDDTNAVEVAAKNDIIPRPSTATVGQTIVVKSVDENGVPTKWETVDLPEQVQPDWNQHYETAPDYIKNRTHWIEVNDDIFFEGDVLNENNYYGYVTLLKPLNTNERYTVVYDGVTYENLEVIYVPQEGFGPPYGDAEYWYLGNTIELGFRLAWHDENTTEVYLEYLQSEAESHSLRVFQSHDVVHQLNSKYLPSEEWIFTLEDGSTVTKKVVLG